jgi:hypothetical protein
MSEIKPDGKSAFNVEDNLKVAKCMGVSLDYALDVIRHYHIRHSNNLVSKFQSDLEESEKVELSNQCNPQSNVLLVLVSDDEGVNEAINKIITLSLNERTRNKESKPLVH